MARLKRRRRIRGKISGTAHRPRLSVFRSSRHIYAQLIDDDMGTVLASASTMDRELRGTTKSGGNEDAARNVGKLLARRASEKKINTLTFDRGGFQYHGRVKALADAVREGGLKF
ncbi:MAG: 50S ribosomal protein L18 [Deltaproteobacteria bacterium]|nr:50S ribosomal protein L18 [Deltaproteobacteria bacterium]